MEEAEGAAEFGPLEHLLPKAQAIARCDDEVRILEISRDHFIPYERATRILNELEALYRYPTVGRAQGRVLIGSSLAGKSSILQEFERNHRADDNVDGDAAIVPVLRVQYPERAAEGVYAAVCQKLGHRIPASASASRIRQDCLDLLRSVDVRILLIDEFHHVLNGNRDDQRVGLATIKIVMNELGRPVVVAGTPEAFNAINKDVQMLSRLRPMYLHRLELEDGDFIELLAGFEMLLPLRKPSNLASEEMALEIHKATGGSVGYISDLLTSLAIQAIQDGTEFIDVQTLRDGDWVPIVKKEQIDRLL